MRFTKMNGAGNDFIIIDNLDGAIAAENLGALAQILCDRRFCIGADGLMAVCKAEGDADFKMRFYNADGSEGEMCGNGARCICRYGFETGLCGEKQVIETKAGIVTGERIAENQYRIRLPQPQAIRLDLKLTACGKDVLCSYAELGNPGIPHAVAEIKALADYDERALFELGKALRYHPEFPKGANVNFYEMTGENEFLLRTWERGVEDFTFACGTGTGSTATILHIKGLVSEKNIRATMRGGLLSVDIVREGSEIRDLFLTGPADMVACGEVLDSRVNL